MNAATLIATINTLLQLIVTLGISWERLSAAIAAAHAEGREFGLADLQKLRDEAAATLRALDEAIARAKGQ